MRSNNRGSVFILSFWTMVLLALMSAGMMRWVSADVAMARYARGKVVSRYAAFAGLFYVIDQVRRDLSDDLSSRWDTAFACGIAGKDGQTAADIFQRQSLGSATFVVSTSEDETRFGLTDETGKINVNALTEDNYGIATQLLIICGVDEKEAEMIVASIMDWKDEDDTVFLGDLGAEQEYYQNLDHAYACKNDSLETVEELRLVRGMTEEIFQKIYSYVTVWPINGPLKVNLNTAAEAVLLAMARFAAGPKTKTNNYDADDFVRWVVHFRSGSDGRWLTADDPEILLGSASLTGSRLAIASVLIPLHSRRALAVRAQVTGQDTRTQVKTVLDAVIETDRLAVVSLIVR